MCVCPLPLPTELGNVVLAVGFGKLKRSCLFSQGIRWECTDEPCHTLSVTPTLSVHPQVRWDASRAAGALPGAAAPGGAGGEDEPPAPGAVPGPALGDSGAAQVSECSPGNKQPEKHSTCSKRAKGMPRTVCCQNPWQRALTVPPQPLGP